MMTKKELLEKALQIFHSKKKGIDSEEFNKQVNEIYKIIEKTPLNELVTFRDLWDSFGYRIFLRLTKPLNSISDDEFIKEFKAIVLTTKKYDFYIPIYCLYGFPRNLKLAQTTVIDFSELPSDVQNHFLSYWKHGFTIDNERHKKLDEYINLKKSSVFIHLSVETNGYHKAMEKARKMAEEALHIIRFVHQLNFNLVDIWYVERGSKNSGGMQEIAGLPFCGGASYVKRDEERYAILTDIFTKRNPNQIEKKIKNTVRIFGIQSAITNNQVRFVLLVSCIESLLMTRSDRDYLGWKVAEKSAFVLGQNNMKVYKYVKGAYDKRSKFIHGDTKKDVIVTREEIWDAENLVINLVWTLIFKFLKEGYSHIKKPEKGKSIDEYIEETKFGKLQNSKDENI